jgi:tripartite-type tricarboxylate transporter receptor subunit TctC
LLGALAAPFAARAQTQGWPAATTRIVVPYPPAGSTDVIARLIQPDLQRRLGTTIIIDNRAGASGSVGTAAVAKAPPDGSSWLLVFDNHAANPFVFPNLPYDTEKDLDPVLLIGTGPHVICAHPSRPYTSFADIVADAQRRPETLSYASVGSGSIGHLAMVLLSKRAGVRLVHVPYRGGGPAMNDAIAGHVDLIIGSTALTCRKCRPARSGRWPRPERVRRRSPSCRPCGKRLPGFEANAFWGVLAPAGTPMPLIERFGSAVAACLREPGVAKQIIETQQVALALTGPEELRKFLSEQMRVGPCRARERHPWRLT